MNNNNAIYTFNLFVEIYLKCKCVSNKLSNYLVCYNVLFTVKLFVGILIHLHNLLIIKFKKKLLKKTPTN